MPRRPTRSRIPCALAVAVASALALGGCEAPPPGPPASSPEGAAASIAPSFPASPTRSQAASPSPSRASATTASCAPTDQDRYVYNPDRLTVKARCLRVSGVIDAIRQEADGDLHILLRLDAPYRRYLTPANQGEELGDLVVEPVCVHPVSQADAIAACAADPDPLQDLPHTGMRVWMEGRYVLDTDHGDWAELHPLYRWGPATTTTGSEPAPTPLPAVTGAGLGVRFTDVPSPALIGGSATIGARTSAGASCAIRVTLPSGRVSTVAALQVPETADGSGDVSWTWSIRSNTGSGTATARVACTLGSKAGSGTTTFSMR